MRSDATQLAGLVGSPSYMSPEQVQEQDLGHHSDMFSLAVVVYELLTGRRPFDGDTDFATLYRITHEAPAAPAVAHRLARAPGRRAAARWPSGRKETGLPPGRLCQCLAGRAARAARPRPQDSEAQRFALLRALPFLPTSTTWRCGS